MRTILLADDESNIRTLVRTTLESPTCRIVEAVDGDAALAVALREPPDLAVLDWEMPGKTGLEVMKALRQSARTATVPIIVLTARGQQSDRDQALAAGANAYLVKPFSPLELLDKVEELGRRTASVAGAAMSAAQPPHAPALAEHEPQLALYVRDLKRVIETEREQARKLAEAHARLQILDRLKSDFLSFISHEMRTPLAHMAVVDLYDPNADPAEQAKVIEMMREGYERLETFVAKGLEYFDWLAGPATATQGTTDLVAACRAAAIAVPDLAKPGVTFELIAPEPCAVRGKSEHHETVLRALLDNAVKFAPGPVHVRAVVRSIFERVVLTVEDDGEGFPPELARELFQPFTIANAEHHAKGTGLSLALASAIVAAHGGHIHAESEGPGTGAIFTIELPSATAHPPKPGA